MTKRILSILSALSLIAASSAFGFTTVTQTNGADADAYANGQILSPQGVGLADWQLTTTTSSTDFANDAIQGGADGLQYVTINTVNNSTDSNAIGFLVNPIDPTDDVQITVSQSLYNNSDTWNGGDNEGSGFFLTWTGGSGLATVNDPMNQLNLSDGQSLASSTQVTFNTTRVRNNADAWSIELPTNANDVEARWASANPQAGSSLTREWISFAANVTSAVPEPSSSVLLALASLILMGAARRR